MSACSSCGTPWTRTNRSIAHPEQCLTCAGSGVADTVEEMAARSAVKCTAAHTAQALADEARERLRKRGTR
jgi:DnaJ-class molecular chaperone